VTTPGGSASAEGASPAPRPRASLAGKAALVTGASRGIGRAIALQLARQGAFVVVHYSRSGQAAQALVETIAGEGGRAAAVCVDLAADDAAQALRQACADALEAHTGVAALDILINNAGVFHRGTIETVTPAQFDETLRVNLRTPFFLIQHCLDLLRDGGRIVNISSMGTRVAYPAMAAYAPAKAGMQALTLLLAAHLGPRGITVNAVLPGLTVTDMNPVQAGTPAGEQAIATIALRRLGQPADIARVVGWLASDDAGWVTGQCIEASGGQRL